MELNNNAWNEVYGREGRVFNELMPAFAEVAAGFEENGCKHILDVGCGTGRHVVALQKQGFDMVGMDLAMNGLTQSRAWLLEENLDMELLCADTRRFFPFSSGSFDGLLSTQVIHHAFLEQVRLTISEIYRVMSRGALAFISVAGRLPDEKITEYEVEPGTVIPHDGREKGLPHHLFTEEEARVEFGLFHIVDIGYRDEGKVLAMWLKKN
jgi:SAM-dependent methyltransferase